MEFDLSRNSFVLIISSSSPLLFLELPASELIISSTESKIMRRSADSSSSVHVITGLVRMLLFLIGSFDDYNLLKLLRSNCFSFLN